METITNASARLAFELTLAGFIGSSDATDDHVLWVTAPSAEDVASAIEGLDCACTPMDFVSEQDIDFVLPDQRDALRQRINQCTVNADRPDRDCDPGCTRRAVPAAECDCSRSKPSGSDPHAAEIQRRIAGFPENELVPHTPEPWQGMLEPGEPNRTVILDGAGNWLMSLFHNAELTQARQESNVRRFVVCVKACAGIPTQMLEAMDVGALSTKAVSMATEGAADERTADAIRHALLYIPENATHDATREALQGWLTTHERRNTAHARSRAPRSDVFLEHEYPFDGPWGYDGGDRASDPYGTPFMAYGPDAVQRAVTRRIVACVNACAAVPTADLENASFVKLDDDPLYELVVND